MSDAPWHVVLQYGTERDYGQVTVFLMDGAKPLGSAANTFAAGTHPTKVADMVKVLVTQINEELDFAAKLQDQLGDQFQVISGDVI